MISKFFCQMGLHDWKILECECICQLWEDVKSELTNGFAMDVRSFGYPFKSKKVCRKCEKLIDEITSYKEKIKPKVKREIELENKYVKNKM